MNLRRSLHTNKGYTLIELMITLFIFAIITMYGVPAFYDFIEQSRAKSQMVKAANFLRSAQEIATSTNRIVYVYTAGYFNYTNHKDDYWTQDWIMSFKPIGKNNIRISAQDLALENTQKPGTPNPNYLIAQQPIFTPSTTSILTILTSSRHNAIDRQSLSTSDAGGLIEMEGYSNVRVPYIKRGANGEPEKNDKGEPILQDGQGAESGKPTFLVFYPSGAFVMPVFMTSNTPLSTTNFFNITDADLGNATGVLAGCRLGGGLTTDVINYTFNKEIIQNNLTFTPTIINGTSGSPPSFSQNICGSKFLQ